jgi:hypothetical protein
MAGLILSHTVSSDQSNAEDIERCDPRALKQINEIFCYFCSSSCITKLDLLYAFYSNLYGADL